MKKKTVERKKEKKIFKEFGKGELHSGSKKGPVVKKRAQAIAIALNEGRKAAHKPKKAPKRVHIRSA